MFQLRSRLIWICEINIIYDLFVNIVIVRWFDFGLLTKVIHLYPGPIALMILLQWRFFLIQSIMSFLIQVANVTQPSPLFFFVEKKNWILIMTKYIRIWDQINIVVKYLCVAELLTSFWVVIAFTTTLRDKKKGFLSLTVFNAVTVNYESPSSGEAYRDRQLTTNFELKFFVCRHVSMWVFQNRVCLSVPRERKSP